MIKNKIKIIGVARRNILEGEKILIYLDKDEGKWKSKQIRIHKPGQRFFSKLYKKIFHHV